MWNRAAQKGEIGVTLMKIGFGSMLAAERVIAVVSPDSAPMKRLIQESRERGMLIDATYGRKTASIFVMDSDHVILSALPPEKFAGTEEKFNVGEKRGESAL